MIEKIFSSLILILQIFCVPLTVYAEKDFRDWIDSGVELKKSGKFAEAVEAFQSAVKANPEYPDAHLQLGSGFQALQRMDQAIEAYREGLRLKPGHRYAAEAYYNMSQAAETLGKGPEAIAYLKKSLQAYTDKNDYGAVLRCGMELKRLSKKFPQPPRNP